LSDFVGLGTNLSPPLIGFSRLAAVFSLNAGAPNDRLATPLHDGVMLVAKGRNLP
jgi:hypothetical protein